MRSANLELELKFNHDVNPHIKIGIEIRFHIGLVAARPRVALGSSSVHLAFILNSSGVHLARS
jgi:hypothetical protein